MNPDDNMNGIGDLLKSLTGVLSTGAGAVKVVTPVVKTSWLDAVKTGLQTWGDLNVSYWGQKKNINNAQADAYNATGTLPAAGEQAAAQLAGMVPAILGAAAIIGVAMIASSAGRK